MANQKEEFSDVIIAGAGMGGLSAGSFLEEAVHNLTGHQIRHHFRELICVEILFSPDTEFPA